MNIRIRPRLLLAAAAVLAAAGLLATRPAPPPTLTAPPLCTAAFHTTAGDFTLEVHRDWAPRAADRFYTLVKTGYYTGNAFFRVIPNFVVQWGLSPTPAATAVWDKAPFPDDPVLRSNLAGTVSFASSGPDSRTAQVFVNLADNHRLDKLGFAPFARVASGLDVIAHFNAEYGEVSPGGRGPDPRLIAQVGAAYLTAQFPRLDVIYSATIRPTPAP